MIWIVCTDTLGYVRENQICFLLCRSCLDFVQTLKMSFDPAKKTNDPADSEGEYSQVRLCRRNSQWHFHPASCAVKVCIQFL